MILFYWLKKKTPNNIISKDHLVFQYFRIKQRSLDPQIIKSYSTDLAWICSSSLVHLTASLSVHFKIQQLVPFEEIMEDIPRWVNSELFFFNLFIFNWRIIASLYFVGCCHISIWISYRYTYVPLSWTLFFKDEEKFTMQIQGKHLVSGVESVNEAPSRLVFEETPGLRAAGV